MKKIFLVFALILCVSLNAKSYTYPLWAWGHTFNANFSAMEYAGDYIYTAGCFSGGPFVFGNANIPNNGSRDVVIMKWDTLGNLIWATSVWGIGDDSVVSIKVNANNEVVVVGSSNSALLHVGANTIASNAGYDIYYAKFDLNGNALNAYIYGTANNEFAIDMCTDYLSNVYIASVGKLIKYNHAGVELWQKNIVATQENKIGKLAYSTVDSTIVLCGSFRGTFTLGNLTLNTQAQGANNWMSDIYMTKMKLNGVPVFLITPGGSLNNFNPKIYIHHTTGNIYITFTANSNLNFNMYQLSEWFPDGTLSNYYWGGLDPPVGDAGSGVELYSMSGRGNYMSVSLADFVENFLIYDITTHTLIKKYVIGSKGPHLFRGLSAIYLPNYWVYGTNPYYNLGKIGDGSLVGIPSNQSIDVCSGNLTTLTGNITGGAGALTYNWLPVTGLNNTNTNTVNFTAANNISYTLTVTDTAGHIAKDTFNIIVQNVIPAANITSQFPAFCDSMQLYSNNNTVGDWYQYIPANLPNYAWQLLASDSVVTIFAAGTYRYEKSNACNSVTDTIVVPGLLTVNAIASSDSICAGQGVTLNGSGAVSYSWTGGVTNNVPFSPAVTQTYIVTGSDANGCTNTSYITVSILSTIDTTNTYLCLAQTPYAWNGQNLDSTGIYTATYTNMFGCDSTEILNLTVSPCIVCVQDFTINYSPFYNPLTESQTWITTSGTVLVVAGTQVKLDAHSDSYVTLQPGFKVEYGAVFVAQAYNGCTGGAPQLPQRGKVFKEDPSAAADEIVLYPNPTSGMIHIKHDEKLSGIQIFDMVGKLIINQKCAGETETNIDLSYLPNGVYHVKAAGYQSIKVVKNN